MNRKFAKSLLSAAALAAGAAGCNCYRNWVDVSYPERYECQARESVTAALTTQAQNGHVLDQTIWNVDFDPGTARLTVAGMKHLTSLGRRRPTPDTVIYLQTANDIEVDPEQPEGLAKKRIELDMARKESVERYLTAETGLQFEVVMPHNPAVPYLFGKEADSIVRDITGSAIGTMKGTTGTSTSGGAGAGGSTSGGGTSGGGR
jgi:hypothetical protein